MAATGLFKAYVLLISAGVLVLTARLVHRAWPGIHFPIVVAAAFLCVPFAREDFGQREHLAVVLSLPYVLMSAAPSDLMSRRTSSLVGRSARKP